MISQDPHSGLIWLVGNELDSSNYFHPAPASLYGALFTDHFPQGMGERPAQQRCPTDDILAIPQIKIIRHEFDRCLVFARAGQGVTRLEVWQFQDRFYLTLYFSRQRTNYRLVLPRLSHGVDFP